jgi:CubicO group peptidase (beta-lactamase class C family)
MLRPLLLLLFCLASLLPATAQEDARVQQIDAYLQAQHDYGLFNGVALVAEGDRVLYQKGFGEAEMAWHVPNTPGTRFRIASVTKQFTAALALQLIESGDLALDEPITRYWPAYPAAQGDRVTVRQLLNHTSGIPSYTGLPNLPDAQRKPHTPEEILAQVWEMPLEFEPGTAYRYNNSGYILLGALVERTTGQPYDVALRERLLEPLGLADSGYDHYAEVIGGLAHGYEQQPDGSYRRAAYLDTSYPYSAGMMYSTAADLHAWTRALHAGEPFQSRETLDQMLTPGLGDYGFGIGAGYTSGADSVRVYGHSGGINGFTSHLAYVPDSELTVAVLDNTQGPSVRISQGLVALALGQEPEPPRRPLASVLMPVIDADGVEAGVARYRAVKASSPDEIDFAEGELNALGYAYLGRGDVQTAVRLFELNVEAYPDAWNVYDSLGEAQLVAGDSAAAAANYQRAYDRNPAAPSARDALQRLGVLEAPAQASVPEAVLEQYVGRYQLQPGFVIEVTRVGTQLSAQATGQPAFDLQAVTATDFDVPQVGAQITFGGMENGRAMQLTLHQGGRTMPAPRID